jgi:hypothetical protein
MPLMDIPYDPEGLHNPSWRYWCGRPIFKCVCGVTSILPKRHDGWWVNDAGIVTPSVHHAQEDGGCGFHSFIRLMDWKGYDHPVETEDDKRLGLKYD